MFQSSFIWIIPESKTSSTYTRLTRLRFNPPSSGSFPKAPHATGPGGEDDQFQSSFIWIIPESRVTVLRKLFPKSKFQSSFIWIIPESMLAGASTRFYIWVSILLHLDHSRKRGDRGPRHPGRLVSILLHLDHSRKQGAAPAYDAVQRVSILLHLDHSRKPCLTYLDANFNGCFNPPSSGSFPKAPLVNAAVKLDAMFQSSFIWIIPESK